MSTNQPQETTDVNQIELNLEDILGQPGADSVMLPQEEEKKPNIFSSTRPDMTFLDKSDNSDNDDPEPEPDSTESIIQQPGAETDLNKGRPRTDKKGLVAVISKLIETKHLIPFEDEKALDDYTEKDFIELIEANFQEKEKEFQEKIPTEFFDSLPEQLQYATKYVADGGKDIKGLFRALGEVEENRSLDPDDENDAESISRNYLRATNFGSEDEIDDEIVSWRDLGKLTQKAKQFKPKLDNMHDQVIAQTLTRQENIRKQQQGQAHKYMENVYNTLEPGELSGVKLDKKTQSMLYNGLVQAQYPSISGKQTNLLGHLLEKYQFVEPNHSLIAEALWLLADPEGFKEKLKGAGERASTEKTVRMLKTEESRRVASTFEEEKNDKTTKKIPRPNQGFFKR